MLLEPIPRSDPTWLGFALTADPEASFGRVEPVDFAEDRKIGSLVVSLVRLIHRAKRSLGVREIVCA